MSILEKGEIPSPHPPMLNLRLEIQIWMHINRQTRMHPLPNWVSVR